MSIQDKLERILRELHIIVSRAPASEINGEYVLVPKKEVQKQLGNLSQTVREMMDEYEVTWQSRNRAELEAEGHRMEILRNAGHQAQDIYAASVIYSEDALGRIQDIILEAENASKAILHRLSQELEEEKRIVRSNQLELLTQLEDMKDTAKYLKLIEERNREIAKEKAKKQEKGKGGKRRREDPQENAQENAQENQSGAPKEDFKDTFKETAYEKPVIKINQEYFRKAGLLAEEEAAEEFLAEEISEIDSIPDTGAVQPSAGKGDILQRFFPFGKKQQ